MVKKMVSSQEKTVGGRYRLLMPIGKGVTPRTPGSRMHLRTR